MVGVTAVAYPAPSVLGHTIPAGHARQVTDLIDHPELTALGGSYVNPPARTWTAPAAEDCLAFHARLPGYAPTPLRPAPGVAERVGAGAVLVKDESSRFGLPAFKFLGASRGVYLALCERLGHEPDWQSLAELRTYLAPLSDPAGLRLLTASAGNHGRAVAQIGRWLGQISVVLLPAATDQEVAAAIAAEGAQVRMIDGDYDDAVRAAMDLATGNDRYVLVQDTAWPGYERIPGWIVQGYRTLFCELDTQLAEVGPADLVVVPVGVGSLLAAAVGHYRSPGTASRPALLSVEPVGAACVLTSLHAGRPVTVHTGLTVLAGLNSGTVSTTTWPLAAAGLDAATAVTDPETFAAQEMLRASGIAAGPCGAATLAGLITVMASPVGEALGLTGSSTVVLVNTEAPTGPAR
jgi:diaminopropionate ammonia-lyase family